MFGSECYDMYLRLEAKGSKLLSQGIGHAAGLEVALGHLCQPSRSKAIQQNLVT